MQEVKEPQGIGFFNVKSGDTHYCKLEPTIAAYINSSDMGINASRGQDFGWKLAPEWVRRVKDFRRDRMQMQMLAASHGGQKPTTVQILYHLYSEDMRAYEEEVDENEAPFADQYQRDIADKPSEPVAAEPASLPQVEPDEVPLDVADEDLEPGEEIDTDAAAEAATSEGGDDASTSEPADSAEGAAEPSNPEPTTAESDKPADTPKKSGSTKTASKSTTQKK